MALDLEEVRKIAALARLDLDAEEEELLVEQLGRIVDYFDQLQQAETAEPDTETGDALPEADDQPAACLPRERFTDNAPRTAAGFLVVPRVKAV